MKQSLGTQLRHLIDLLDGAVDAAYRDAGLDYRPRFTPVMRALIEREPQTIGEIAAHAGISQPAATQTIALMVKEGWVTAKAGKADARQKLIALSKEGKAKMPQIQACWAATAAAARSLDADLPLPLSQVLGQAIAALEAHPYGERIATARAKLAKRP